MSRGERLEFKILERVRVEIAVDERLARRRMIVHELDRIDLRVAASNVNGACYVGQGRVEYWVVQFVHESYVEEFKSRQTRHQTTQTFEESKLASSSYFSWIKWIEINLTFVG